MRDDRREIIIAWMPAERIAYTLAGGHDARGVAFSPRRVLDLEIDSRHTLDCFDHLTNGEAVAIAAIERQRDSAGPQIAQCQLMRIDEIADMDVITDTRTIGRRIVGAENFELWPQSQGRFPATLVKCV